MQHRPCQLCVDTDACWTLLANCCQKQGRSRPYMMDFRSWRWQMHPDSPADCPILNSSAILSLPQGCSCSWGHDSACCCPLPPTPPPPHSFSAHLWVTGSRQADGHLSHLRHKLIANTQQTTLWQQAKRRQRHIRTKLGTVSYHS
jgi:hypothetical protein